MPCRPRRLGGFRTCSAAAFRKILAFVFMTSPTPASSSGRPPRRPRPANRRPPLGGGSSWADLWVSLSAWVWPSLFGALSPPLRASRSGSSSHRLGRTHRARAFEPHPLVGWQHGGLRGRERCRASTLLAGYRRAGLAASPRNGRGYVSLLLARRALGGLFRRRHAQEGFGSGRGTGRNL